MNLFLFAPKIESNAAMNTADFIIQSGNAVRVWGIFLSQSDTTNSNGTVLTASIGDDSDKIWETTFNARSVKNIDIPFIADKGIRFSATTDNVRVTILYSNLGS